MISEILIKNYILIDELELDFSGGLNIITGETGAGKSILIHAIDIAFGAKAGKEVVKTGCEKAVIELTLKNNNHNLDKLFEEYGVDNNGEEIIISREISQTSSKSRVNGCMVNQDFLKLLREQFLDIHSQHQAYTFLQPKYHIQLLDSYIKDPELIKYKEDYEKYKNMLSKLEELKNASQKTEEQIEFLKFQAEEIEKAEILSTDEDEVLNRELAVLENAEKLKELTGSSYWAISGDNGSILDGLYEIKNSVSKASSMDEKLEEAEGEIAGIIDSLKAVSADLREYSSSMENDTARIDQIQERLFTLDKLKRKYGGTLENVIIAGKNFRDELDKIEFSTSNIENLEKEISEKEQHLLSAAKSISEKRKIQGKILSDLIVKKLEKLELPKVKFEIGFEEIQLSANGVDKIEFLISTNISEELKPLAKIASGGEISRVMLAIKSIFAQADNIDTVIFDEIDTGISGRTSQSVADEVKELSKFMQIIMITHQAIIASKADRHFYVKKTQGETTNVGIYILEGENKIKGVAELASGEITDESMNFAKMLIEQ